MAEEKRYDVLGEATFGEGWEREVRAFSLDDLIDAFRRTGLEVHRSNKIALTAIAQEITTSTSLSIEQGKVAHLEGEVERITSQRNDAVVNVAIMQESIDSKVECIEGLRGELQLVQDDRNTLQAEKDKAEHLALVARGEA